MSVNLTASKSAVVTDGFGISHIAWLDNGVIWHAVYNNNSETWENAVAIAVAGTQPICNLSIIASNELIQNDAEAATANSSGKNLIPGLAVVWQQGDQNDSDFYYTAAQYDANADLQWLPAVQPLTADAVADQEPTLTSTGDGELVVIGTKANLVNAANQSIQEDTDPYLHTFRISSSQFAANPSTPPPPTPGYVPQLSSDGIVNLGALKALQSSSSTATAAQASASPAAAAGTETDLVLSATVPESPGWDTSVAQFGTQFSFSSNPFTAWAVFLGVPIEVSSLLNFLTKNVIVQGAVQTGYSFGTIQYPYDALYLNSNTTVSFQAFGKSTKSEIPGWKTGDRGDNNGALSKFLGLGLGKDFVATVFENVGLRANLALNLDSGYYFDASLDLASIVNSFTVSLGLNRSFVRAKGMFAAEVFGSVGASLRLTGKPASPGGNWFPKSFTLGISEVGTAAALGVIARLVSSSGAEAIAAQIALDTALTGASWVEGTLGGMDVDALLIAPLISVGGQGNLCLGSFANIQVNLQVQGQLDWTNPMTVQVSFPLSLSASFGGAGLTASWDPIWTLPTRWQSPLSSGDSSATAASTPVSPGQSQVNLALADPTATATAAGCLITVDFGTAIKNLPPASAFTVQATNALGTVTSYPVFAVAAGPSSSQLILRLEKPMAMTEVLDYTKSSNPMPAASSISLSFSNSNSAQAADGTALPDLVNLAVTNATPTSLTAYQFLPISGNSEDYASPSLFLTFGTALATNASPDSSRFTVKSGSQSLAVNSVVVSSDGVSLVFAPSVTSQMLQGAMVSYSNESSLGPNPLRDSANNQIASFAVQSGASLQVSAATQATTGSTLTITLPDLPAALAAAKAAGGAAAADKLKSAYETIANYGLSLTQPDGSRLGGVSIQSAKLMGNQVFLSLNQNLPANSTASVSYNKNPLASSAVLALASASTQPLSSTIAANLANESTPLLFAAGSTPLVAWVSDVPTLLPIAGVVQDQQILLSFNGQLGNSADVPSVDQFTVVDGSGQSYSVQNISSSNSSLQLTLDRQPEAGAQLSISYALSDTQSTGTDKPAHANLYLRNAYTNTDLWVPAFRQLPLVNSLATGLAPNTNPPPPALLASACVVETNNSNQITLVFNQALADQGVTYGNFVVRCNGIEYSGESNVEVNGNTVVLTVLPPDGANLIGTGDLVTVDYRATTIDGKPVLAAAGLETVGVASFTGQPVNTAASKPSTIIQYGSLSLGEGGSQSASAGNSASDVLPGVNAISSIPGMDGINIDPAVGRDPQGTSVLVWTHADSSAIDTSNLISGQYYSSSQAAVMSENFAQSDIYYSIYDPAGWSPNGSSGSWSVAAPLSQQVGSQGNAVIGMGPNNQLMAVWLSTVDKATTIYYSSLIHANGSQSSWSQPQVLYTDAKPDPLTELRILSVAGQPTVLWTQTQATCYAQLTVEKSPLLYYRLAETSGTTLINIGSYGAGGNGSYSGSVALNQTGALENTSTRQGDPNPAVLFNAAASASSASVPLSGSSFSVEFWFKAASLSSTPIQLLSLSGLLSISATSSGIGLDLNGTVLNSSNFTPSDNQWCYVVATYNGMTDSASLYVNGQQTASASNLSLTIPGRTTVTMGSTANGSSVLLDEVAVYNQVLAGDPAIDLRELSQLTAKSVGQTLLADSNTISTKYDSRYVEPLPPGPNTNYVSFDGSRWLPPTIINPSSTPVATELADANAPAWDVTSYVTASSGGYVSPNGIADIYLHLSLANQVTGNKITSIGVSSTNSAGTTTTWSVGPDLKNSGYQLAVVQGEKLLNPINPSGSFDCPILSPTVELDLYLDNNGQPAPASFDVTIYYDGSAAPAITVNPLNSSAETTVEEALSVLAIATVSEANDSELSLIDSGFIISTDNINLGYQISSADFNGDGFSDVAIGSRGYTDMSGKPVQGATVQIAFGKNSLLTNQETTPLALSNLSGNADGLLITGLSDSGIANGNSPVSLASGDVNGDTYADLVIGDPNVNKVYVIYGSSSGLEGRRIDIAKLSSSQGYVISAPTPANTTSPVKIAFGYSVAIGNFNGSSNADIAIGAPNANGGNGAVYVAYDGKADLSLIYNSSNSRELAGCSLAVSSATAGASTFTGNQQSDDLIIGARGFQGNVNNQWSGLSELPANVNSNPNGTPTYPASSSVALGAVYVFQSNGNTTNPFSETAYATYTGPNTVTSNGTADDSNAGTAVAIADVDGDTINDLIISAPGAASNAGAIYVLKGGVAASSAAQNLGSVANLQITGGISLSQTGTVVTSPGDVNDDKIQDLLITASQAANSTGQGYVVFGSGDLLSGVGNQLDLTSTASANKSAFLLNGDQPYQLVGAAASGVGDINGDGVDDLMISAPNAKQLYAVYGHPWLADDGSIKLPDICGDNGFVVDGDLYFNSGVGYNLIYQIPDQEIATAPCLLSNAGILYLAYQGMNSMVYLTTSNNSGQSWSGAVQLPTPTAATAPPSIAFLNGTLYLAYQDINNQLNLMSTADGGLSWTLPVQLPQFSSNGVSLAVVDGALYAFFIANDGTSQILFTESASPSSVSTWSAAQAIVNTDWIPQTSATAVSAVVLPNNQVYLAYRGGVPGNPGNYYFTSPNGTIEYIEGAGWAVNELTQAANPNTAPNLTCGSGNQIYLTYVDANQSLQVLTASDVPYNILSSALSWSAPQQITGQTSDCSVSAAAVNGQLFIAYAGTNDSPYITALASSGQSMPLSENGYDVLMLGDVNGDGFSDVLSAGSPYGGILVFGEGTTSLIDAATGTDDVVITVANAGISSFVALGDINSDGFADFGAIDSNNGFYLNLGSASTLPYGSTLILSTPYITSIVNAVAIGDVNGDGYGDVAMQSSNGNWNNYYGNSSGGLVSPSASPNGSTVNELGDLNSDGYSDYGVGDSNANGTNGQFTIYYGGTLESKTINSQTINPPQAVLSAELGASWTSQYAIPNQTAGCAPSIVEFNGYLYMVYNSPDSVDGNNNTLWLQRSADGINWEGLTNLGSGFETYYQASLAVFNNTLCLAFTATNNQVILASAVDDASSDLGLTFSGGQFYQVAGNTSNYGPTLVSYDNSLYVFFLADNPSQTILYSSSTDPFASSSWSSNSPVPYNGGNNASNDRIGAAVYDGNLYIAFMAGDGTNDIYVTSYDGTTWASANNAGSDAIVSGQTTPVGPSLVATEDNLYLFYLANNSSESICYYTYAGQGASSSSVSSISGQSSSDRPSPVLFNQSIYVAHVGYNNDQSIYMTASNPIQSINYAQQLGAELQGIGDFNGDGTEDCAVLAPGYSSLGGFNSSNQFVNNQGGLYIYYGSASGSLAGAPNVVLNPNYSTNLAGTNNIFLSEFSAIGDINGDGYDDVAVASPTSSVDSGTTADGLIYVVFGGPSWASQYTATNPFDLNQLSNDQSNSTSNDSNSLGFMVKGLPASQSGISLAGGSDINGDSLADLIVGAPGNDNNLSYVIFGSDFNDQVSQTGTIGDDVMVGSATGESFLGNQGDDTIYSNGGIDVVYAGPGNDAVTIRDTFFRRIDGGTGTDALLFEGYNGQSWDLTTLSPGSRLQSFEVLVTSNYGANRLTLNSLAVTQLSSTNTIAVQMDASDTLNLSSDFDYAGTVYRANQNLDLYTSSSSAARVLLNRIPASNGTNAITVVKEAPALNRPAPVPTATSASAAASQAQQSVPSTATFLDAANPEAAMAFSSVAMGNPNAATSLVVSSPRVMEAAGTAEFVIQRSGDLSKYVWVNYTTKDADSIAGDRYLPVAGKLMFAPGEASKTVSVPIVDNQKYVGTRRFGLLLSIDAESRQSDQQSIADYHLQADGNGEQLRRWSQASDDANGSLWGNVLQFDATTTQGSATVDLKIDGISSINTIYAQNSATGKYEELVFNGSTGAIFAADQPEDRTQAQLRFLDGQAGDADGRVNGLVQLQGYAGRVIPGLLNHQRQTFWAPTAADGQTQLRLIRAPQADYEFGWLRVDDINGKIKDGDTLIAATDSNYAELLKAKLADPASKVILFADQASASSDALTRALADGSFANATSLSTSEGQFFGDLVHSQLPANQYYVMYAVVDGKATFSSLQAPSLLNQGRGYYQLEFAGLSAEIGSQALVIPGKVNVPVPVDISLSRAAEYKNTIALYRVDDLTGGIDVNGDQRIDLKPEDKDYMQAALTRARDPLTGFSLITPNNLASTSQRVDLLGSAMYGLLILPNASIDDVLRKNPDNNPRFDNVAFCSFASANSDGKSHVSRLGNLMYGFEDQLYGGDNDFNDMILKITLSAHL